MLGVHLCGTLSLRALDTFNTTEAAVFLALKPCCLPPLGQIRRNRGAKGQEVNGTEWHLGGHTINSGAVGGEGKYVRGAGSGSRSGLGQVAFPAMHQVAWLCILGLGATCTVWGAHTY